MRRRGSRTPRSGRSAGGPTRRWPTRLERIGLDAFVQEWLAAADVRRAARPGRASIEERRTNTAEGLAASLRHAGTGSMEPLWDRLDGLDGPGAVRHRARSTSATPSWPDAMVDGIGTRARHVR